MKGISKTTAKKFCGFLGISSKTIYSDLAKHKMEQLNLVLNIYSKKNQPLLIGKLTDLDPNLGTKSRTALLNSVSAFPLGKARPSRDGVGKAEGWGLSQDCPSLISPDGTAEPRGGAALPKAKPHSPEGRSGAKQSRLGFAETGEKESTKHSKAPVARFASSGSSQPTPLLFREILKSRILFPFGLRPSRFGLASNGLLGIFNSRLSRGGSGGIAIRRESVKKLQRKYSYCSTKVKHVPILSSLESWTKDNIKTLITINSYRGRRFKYHYPTKGQRTRSNANTAYKLNRIK